MWTFKRKRREWVDEHHEVKIKCFLCGGDMLYSSCGADIGGLTGGFRCSKDYSHVLPYYLYGTVLQGDTTFAQLKEQTLPYQQRLRNAQEAADFFWG